VYGCVVEVLRVVEEGVVRMDFLVTAGSWANSFVFIRNAAVFLF